MCSPGSASLPFRPVLGASSGGDGRLLCSAVSSWPELSCSRLRGRRARQRASVVPILRDFARSMRAIAFREAILFMCLTYGNGYAEIVRDLANRPSAIWPLIPDRVTPRRLDKAQGYTLVYDYANPDGSFTTLPASDVLHFHGPGIHGLMGDNLVARMAKSIALAAAHERFASTYFGNNTVIGGWIEYPRVLGPEAHTQMQKSWEDQHKGPDKAHKAIIMENGAKYHAVDSNAEKAQLIESRQFQLEEICRWYKVPPHKVQHLTRAT